MYFVDIISLLVAVCKYMIIKLLMFVLQIIMLMLLLSLQHRFEKSIYPIAIPYHAPPAWQTLYHSRKIRSLIRPAHMALVWLLLTIVSNFVTSFLLLIRDENVI